MLRTARYTRAWLQRRLVWPLHILLLPVAVATLRRVAAMGKGKQRGQAGPGARCLKECALGVVLHGWQGSCLQRNEKRAAPKIPRCPDLPCLRLGACAAQSAHASHGPCMACECFAACMGGGAASTHWPALRAVARMRSCRMHYECPPHE